MSNQSLCSGTCRYQSRGYSFRLCLFTNIYLCNLFLSTPVWIRPLPHTEGPLMNHFTILFFGFLIYKLNFWQFLIHRTIVKIKRVYKCKDLRTMVGTINISHYFHWNYICVFLLGCVSFSMKEPCFATCTFQSTNILELFLCQPPFKLLWMGVSWVQPLRMDVSCSSIDGQGSLQFFSYYEFAMENLVCDFFWTQVSVSLE